MTFSPYFSRSYQKVSFLHGDIRDEGEEAGKIPVKTAYTS
jgi:hypothetical protein